MELKEWIIDVVGLSKTIKKHTIVSDVTIKIRRGEIFGFIGPNGGGKTTIIRMLCGLLMPTGGSGKCLGFDLLTQTELIKRYVGHMSQYFSLYNNLTVYENLDFRAQLYGIVDRRKKIELIMEQMEFGKYRNHLARELSGGWKQRLSLGAAILHDPLILMLDEPTASIDLRTVRDFWAIINELSDRGITILLSSHNMDEVEHCHRIAYMGYGKILRFGTIKEIMDSIALKTWSVIGSNLSLLAKQLYGAFGVELVTGTYSVLHICGRDLQALIKSIEPYRNNINYHWEMVDSTLEDTFLWLLSNNY